MSETLLEKNNMNSHFAREHKSKFIDKQIQFMSKKGRTNSQNQDNIFIILDGDVKIIGVFDGHGLNGHQVSSLAQGKMLEFIRNIHGDFFDQKVLKDASKEEIERKIKQAFKYVQG